MVQGIPIAPLALPREFPITEFPAVFFHPSTGWELGFGPKLSGRMAHRHSYTWFCVLDCLTKSTYRWLVFKSSAYGRDLLPNLVQILYGFTPRLDRAYPSDDGWALCRG